MINGKAYTLRHDEPEEYMHRIEHFLNTKVAAAAKADLRLEQQTAIVMAAISITDELFKTQKNFKFMLFFLKLMLYYGVCQPKTTKTCLLFPKS